MERQSIRLPFLLTCSSAMALPCRFLAAPNRSRWFSQIQRQQQQDSPLLRSRVWKARSASPPLEKRSSQTLFTPLLKRIQVSRNIPCGGIGNTRVRHSDARAYLLRKANEIDEILRCVDDF